MLVPEVAQGAAPETADVLAACDAAVARLCHGAAPLVVVGRGPDQRVHDGGAVGTFAGFGVALTGGGEPAGSAARAAAVAAALAHGRRVAPGPGRGPCGTAPLRRGGGGRVRDRRRCGPGGQDETVDGSSWATGRRGCPSVLPAAHDPRAVGVRRGRGRRAGLAGTRAALTGLDQRDGAGLVAAGVPAWRAVGTALLVARPDRRWTATVTSHAVPYGVSYVVATWD